MHGIKHLWKCLGPIILSALSLFISFFILQTIASFVDPELSLLARGGLGKVVLTAMVFWQLILFLSIQSTSFLDHFFQTNFLFFKTQKWVKPFLITFSIFFVLHALLMFFLYSNNIVQYNPNWGTINGSLLLKTTTAFGAVFTLAWSEELIFRGTLYPYFATYLTPLKSALIASMLFMFAHNLADPLILITQDWQLGLGLFLLGFMLNLLFIKYDKLYIGMGAHAGLVGLKVLLRRAPFLLFNAPAQLPFWAHTDLRQSFLVHGFFMIAIGILIYSLSKKNNTFNI